MKGKTDRYREETSRHSQTASTGVGEESTCAQLGVWQPPPPSHAHLVTLYSWLWKVWVSGLSLHHLILLAAYYFGRLVLSGTLFNVTLMPTNIHGSPFHPVHTHSHSHRSNTAFFYPWVHASLPSSLTYPFPFLFLVHPSLTFIITTTSINPGLSLQSLFSLSPHFPKSNLTP